MSSRKKILLLHLAGQYPLGGVGWQAAHYIVGLTRLGHEVYYVEDSGVPLYDPRVGSIVDDCSYGVDFVQRMMKRFGLGDHWVYWDICHNRYYGISRERLLRLYEEADAVLNICGATWLREEHLRCPVRIFVETDPVYEEIKIAQGNLTSSAFLEAHIHHFTYGESLGRPDCPIPTGPFHWRPMPPPSSLSSGRIVLLPRRRNLPLWRLAKNMSKDVSFRGKKYYWSKHLNSLRFQDLPRYSSQKFELALGTADPDIMTLWQKKGWLLVDSYEKSLDLDVYQDYIYSSRGGFTVAKDLVARTKSGWFSDRSVCYLAAGKPVVTQETGFSKFIPTGRGLFAFRTMEEVLAAVDGINADYETRCRAAREVAQEYFAGDKILKTLLRDADL
jgi:hypothetical protein